MSSLFSAPDLKRSYRFVDRSGQPHPILDDQFDSLDAAWEAVQAWLEQRGLSTDAMPAVLAEEFGLEVSTAKGHWRTLRHPGQRSWASLTCPIGRPPGA